MKTTLVLANLLAVVMIYHNNNAQKENMIPNGGFEKDTDVERVVGEVLPTCPVGEAI